MDWGSVTAEDLIDALREVDWSSPPRPLSEFFSRFTLPRSYSKWNSRLKCKLYYYRTNYFILIVFILGIGFLRMPLAILAAALNITFLLFPLGTVSTFGLSAFVSIRNTLQRDILATILRASFRTPNLKARLNTFQEEFL